MNKSSIDKTPFIALIKRYREITIEDIERTGEKHYYSNAAFELTGFGSCFTCTLCNYFSHNCSLCYGERKGKLVACLSGAHEETYRGISIACAAEELFEAFNERADHIEEWLERYDDIKKGGENGED